MAEEENEVVGGEEEDTDEEVMDDDEDTEEEGEPLTPDGTDDNVDPTASPNGEAPDAM